MPSYYVEEHDSRYCTTSLVKRIKGRPSTDGLVEASSFCRNEVNNLIGKHFAELAYSSIQEVKNDFLELMFLLKKAEMKCRNGVVQERLLVHVTGSANVKSIVRENFDWRRVTRGKFGVGTSFSDDAHYANRYANRNIGDERAFIISRVLVSRSSQGRNRMEIPPPGIDTTVGNGTKVYVKFSDNEAYPKYVIYFKCNNSQSRTFAKLSHINPRNSFLERQYYFEYDDSDSSDGEDITDHISSVTYTSSLDVAARPPHLTVGLRTIPHHPASSTTLISPSHRPTLYPSSSHVTAGLNTSPQRPATTTLISPSHRPNLHPSSSHVTAGLNTSPQRPATTTLISPSHRPTLYPSSSHVTPGLNTSPQRPATTTLISPSHRPTLRTSYPHIVAGTRTTHWSQTPPHPASPRVKPTPPRSSALNCVIL